MALSRTNKTHVGPKVDINIVPLVDVSLVLLIIFMVTATFIKAAGIDINLPASAASAVEKTSQHEAVIGVAADGTFYWRGEAVTDEKLKSLLEEDASEHGTEGRVIVQGDERAAHGRIVKAMTIAKQAGYTRLIISTRKEFESDVQAR